ncbi:hypothetical protein F5X99DRAFT_395565 [Biscogniauxia marginata]|nr:hypothetical protein F5X99DRAFT_395565 [Biscogniauxia marginata]
MEHRSGLFSRGVTWLIFLFARRLLFVAIFSFMFLLTHSGGDGGDGRWYSDFSPLISHDTKNYPAHLHLFLSCPRSLL